MSVGLVHIGITVADTQRSVDFYCGLLGLEQITQYQYRPEDVEKVNGLKNARGQSTGLAAPGTPGVRIDFDRVLHAPRRSRRHSDRLRGSNTYLPLGGQRRCRVRQVAGEGRSRGLWAFNP
jgi:catechol 2,3-dioxygenase-like lactoylglutathione lyase family enzyme